MPLDDHSSGIRWRIKHERCYHAAGHREPFVGRRTQRPNSPLAKSSIYFDFDSYDVKIDYLPLPRDHASYLRDHPAQHVLIQGNTDERCTDEYNLALTERTV